MKTADISVGRAYFDDCTLSRMFLADGQDRPLFIIELPYRGNAPDISSIEPGLYPYRVAHSPRAGRDVIWIDEVEGRTNIQVHPANFVDQILGCLGPGFSIQAVDDDDVPDVGSSESAMNYILQRIPRTGFIRIYDATKPIGVYK